MQGLVRRIVDGFLDGDYRYREMQRMLNHLHAGSSAVVEAVERSAYRGSPPHMRNAAAVCAVTSDLEPLVSRLLSDREPWCANDLALLAHDERQLRRIARASLDMLCPREASKSYEALRDKRGMMAAIRLHERLTPTTVSRHPLPDMMIEELLQHYAGRGFYESLNARYLAWASEKGIRDAYALNPNAHINTVFHTLPGHDVGVAISRGGLLAGFLAQQYGLRVLVVDAHRWGKSARLRWVDEPCDLKGARVIVYDKDVVTGRTADRVVRELSEHGVASMDLALNIAYRLRGQSIGTVAQNIPSEFASVWHSRNFSYTRFDAAMAALLRGMRAQESAKSISRSTNHRERAAGA